MIAARQIRPPNRSVENYVADQREAMFRIEEYDMAGRVAGTGAHLEFQAADRDFIAMFEQTGRPAVAHAGHSVAAAHLCQAVEQKFVLLAGTDDRNAKSFGKFFGSPGVIDMSVGEQDLLGPDGIRFDGTQDAVDFPARIDDRRLAAFAVP